MEPIDSSGIGISKVLRYRCNTTDSIAITGGWFFFDTTAIEPPFDSLKIWHHDFIPYDAGHIDLHR